MLQLERAEAGVHFTRLRARLKARSRELDAEKKRAGELQAYVAALSADLVSAQASFKALERRSAEHAAKRAFADAASQEVKHMGEKVQMLESARAEGSRRLDAAFVWKVAR